MRILATMLVGAAMLVGACAPETPPQSDLSLGVTAVKEGRLSAAEQHFTAVLADDPNDPYANVNLGMIKARTGRRDEAIGHYQLAAANGENVPVQGVMRPGAAETEEFDGTIADVARRNLANLGV